MTRVTLSLLFGKISLLKGLGPHLFLRAAWLTFQRRVWAQGLNKELQTSFSIGESSYFSEINKSNWQRFLFDLSWENLLDRGAWQATVHRVTQNQTWPSSWAHTHDLLVRARWTQAQLLLALTQADTQTTTGEACLLHLFVRLSSSFSPTIESTDTP